MPKLKVLETRYGGVRYRSRTEARWAVFFDMVGIRHHYEPEGFELRVGYYRPDFWLTDLRMFFEVKGTEPTADEIAKCADLTHVTEADLVAAFVAGVEKWNANRNRTTSKWTTYPETAGWDLLLVDEAGIQIGIEAKLSLNAKVICQALPYGTWAMENGPDYRAVLVPERDCQGHMHPIARALGLTIITVSKSESSYDKGRISISPTGLPDEHSGHDWDLRQWVSWLPAERCRLPDYVPDVQGGKPCPVALTDWKIKAIKLIVLLERRGYVTRRDMKLIGISPTRWTDAYHGFLTPDPIKGGYIRNGRTPDLKAQHPVNYIQIEADFETWAAPDWNAGCAAAVANDPAPLAKEAAA